MDASGTGVGNGATSSGTPSAASQRLLSLRREADPTSLATTETRRDPAAASPGQGKQGGMVMVWPQLVSIELTAMLVFTLMLLILGTAVNAPLVLVANPDATPDPSKAPWYFLNLQELLLHMHPSLAGVFVPGGALVLLAAIPYIDTRPQGTAVWFTSNAGREIAIYSIIYATVLELAMILFNEYVGVRRILQAVGSPAFVIEFVIPILAMYGWSHLLVVLVRRRWPAHCDTRHILIALFSGFFATFIVLTIIGTAFRGSGMHLFLPWDIVYKGLH